MGRRWWYFHLNPSRVDVFPEGASRAAPGHNHAICSVPMKGLASAFRHTVFTAVCFHSINFGSPQLRQVLEAFDETIAVACPPHAPPNDKCNKCFVVVITLCSDQSDSTVRRIVDPQASRSSIQCEAPYEPERPTAVFFHVRIHRLAKSARTRVGLELEEVEHHDLSLGSLLVALRRSTLSFWLVAILHTLFLTAYHLFANYSGHFLFEVRALCVITRVLRTSLIKGAGFSGVKGWCEEVRFFRFGVAAGAVDYGFAFLKGSFRSTML